MTTRIIGGWRPTTRRVLLALFVASFLVRAAYMILVVGVDQPFYGDQAVYHGTAASFLRGDGWEDPSGRKSFLPPLLPFQLLPVYVFTGPSPAAGKWTVVFFSSLVAPLLFLVARKILRGRSDVALLAAAAWVLYPPAIHYAHVVLTESTAALLVVGSLGAFLWAARSRSVWAILLTGMLWALASLNRPAFLFLPPALALTQVALSRFGPIDWTWSLRAWVLGIAAFAVAMTPWTVRNYVEHGVLMPTHSAGGYVLLITNGNLSHPSIQAGMYYYRDPEYQRVLSQAESEAEVDAISRRMAIEELKRNWRLLPRPIFNRAKNFWTPRLEPYDPSFTRDDLIMLVVWTPIMAFFLISSFTRSWRQNWPALTVILLAFLLTVPFWGSPRFRFPVDPLIITAAAVGLVESRDYLSSAIGRRRRRAEAAIGLQRSNRGL